jgi:tetratricopeptide (TPR) repeat protein
VLVAQAEESLLVGEFAHARLTAEEAVLAFPDDAAAHLALGRVLLAEGRLEEAAMRFAQALECDAGSVAALRLLGLARAGQGRFVEALDAWDRWLVLEPLPVGERGRTELVERLRGAAGTLNDALGGRREQ